jgi:hypothetical protein
MLSSPGCVRRRDLECRHPDVGRAATAEQEEVVISQVYGGGGNSGRIGRTTSSSCSIGVRPPWM